MIDNTFKNTNFIVMVLLLTVLIALSPAFAAPAGSGLGNVDSVLKNIVDMITGTTARLIATICVAAVGIGWMSGFIDLRKAAYCTLGIGIVFGASSLVTKLMGSS
ncbi:TrbC/VirB2 family protein [Bartonella sp. B35(2025)]